MRDWITRGSQAYYEQLKRDHHVDEFNAIARRKVRTRRDYQQKRVAYLDFATRYPDSVLAPMAGNKAAEYVLKLGNTSQALSEFDGIESKRPVPYIVRWVKLGRADALRQQGRWHEAAQAYHEISHYPFPRQKYLDDINLSRLECLIKAGDVLTAQQMFARFNDRVRTSGLKLSDKDQGRLMAIRSDIIPG